MRKSPYEEGIYFVRDQEWRVGLSSPADFFLPASVRAYAGVIAVSAWIRYVVQLTSQAYLISPCHATPAACLLQGSAATCKGGVAHCSFDDMGCLVVLPAPCTRVISSASAKLSKQLCLLCPCPAHCNGLRKRHGVQVGDRYQLLNAIGDGTFSSVCSALDTLTGEQARTTFRSQ